MSALAERLDASEILQPASLCIQERLVDAEIMRVTVHVGDRLAERDDLIAERDEEFLEAVRQHRMNGVPMIKVATPQAALIQ